MQQIDNLNELPKEKRPTEDIIWDGTTEEMEDWLDKVLDTKSKNKTDGIEFVISNDNVEG